VEKKENYPGNSHFQVELTVKNKNRHPEQFLNILLKIVRFGFHGSCGYLKKIHIEIRQQHLNEFGMIHSV
jgi:hypothetical protein